MATRGVETAPVQPAGFDPRIAAVDLTTGDTTVRIVGIYGPTNGMTAESSHRHREFQSRLLNPAGGDHSWINTRFGSQRLDHTLVGVAAGEIRTCAYDHTTRADELSDHAALLTTVGLRSDSAATNGHRP